ncbi:MAG: hypothetical protein IKQ30_06635 [Bacteroidales bacterium]|nr:hypothetical protein [Bacteroidales bacterium]
MKNGICPYPGLRPFTEEESIFFKGRDTHIRQIAKLLEENKMAFITGASGDGKSSMVYAGVLPYIRAGFTRAKFNSWLIFDFKPQRNPLASLAESAAKEMDMPYDYMLREFRRGFSTLAHMYVNSEYYIEDGDYAANKGNNLLIIADQFEEVFTMNENFHDGTPSNDSYTCINLLLETIRIAIREDLPIYVIFTMRSDYISQCTVFKDLPEFIAYSQFFVPQLKRSEIRQVIEQPAQLAGGSVSSRLAEVLINNLTSGFDQLPVLQHALNLLWKTANNGETQLDLIHLAKIAGIAKDVLSDEEQKEFDRWYFTLPEYRKKYYDSPDLNNVLNAHAGTLYESAYDYFMKHADWADKNITPEQSKKIIETAFKSLTKIDNNRQVRNRCTLNEITGIINNPDITSATVCGVLNIFRSEDNTLLRPFAVEGKLDTQYLSGETMLDVTHEALIRNWQMLSHWDVEELENLNTYNDFNGQVQRWIDNNRNPEFLLAAGNYAFFNDWYQKCKPNPHWILKHDASTRPDKEKLRAATSRYELCESYLNQSDEAIKATERAHRKKIALAIGGLVVFVVGLLIFSMWAMDEQRKAEKAEAEAIADRDKAQNSEAEAKRQKDTADVQRNNAKNALVTAENEKKRAEDAYKETLKALKLADSARKAAEHSEERAKRSANDAEQRRQEAVAAGNQAKHAQQQAEQAQQEAERLYYVTLCNTLAMKAKNQYEDTRLNLRLANEAYKISQDNGMNAKKNPELYDAMLYSLEQNGIIEPLKLDSKPKKSFAVDKSGCIITIDNDAIISKYKIMPGGKTQRIMTNDDNSDRLPVETAVFASSDVVVYSLKDKTSYIADVTNKTRTPLPVKTDYIRNASVSPDGKSCAVAYNNGTVAIVPTNGMPSKDQVKDFSTKLTDVLCTGNGNAYVLCHDGSLIKWDYNNNKETRLLAPTPGKSAFKMTQIPKKNQLAVCYSDGTIQFLDMQSGKVVANKPAGHTKLENMLYDPKTDILALASADKRILLYNVNDLNATPIAIEEHSLSYNNNKAKVKSMFFNDKGVLFALTDDNQLHFWDTDITTYANTLKTMNLSPLSQSERDMILGGELSEK